MCVRKAALAVYPGHSDSTHLLFENVASYNGRLRVNFVNPVDHDISLRSTCVGRTTRKKPSELNAIVMLLLIRPYSHFHMPCLTRF